MRKNIFLVKSVLMSMLTAVTFSFASCSDNEFVDNTPNNPSAEIQDPSQVGDYSKFEPYGLTFHNFDGDDNAVQILNADTTEIAVSKKLADKLGIKSFVNHPLGIWRSKGTCAFARKAYEEQLVGDTYILKVKTATVAELIGKKQAMLSTEVIVNENTEAVKTRAASSNIPEYAAKYVDENDVIHPSVVLLTDPFGYDEQGHYPDEQPTANMTRGNNGEYEYLTPEEIVGSKTRFGVTGRILKANNTIDFNHKLECGKQSGDTITVKGEIPVDFELNYFLQLDGGIKWKAFIPLPEVKRFESGLDGQFGFSPKVTVGFSKKLELPEKKQKLTLYKFNSFNFTFMIGPIPVSIFCKPSLFLNFDASVEGNAQIGIQYEYANSFRAGVGYYKGDGWKSLNNFEEQKNEISLIKPEVNFKAEAGIGLMLGAEVKIYDVAGPEAAVGPRLGAEAEVTVGANGFDWHAQIDLSIQAQVGAKLEILGYELAEYKTTFDLAGPWTLLKFPLEAGDNIHKTKAQRAKEKMQRRVKENIYMLEQMRSEKNYRSRFEEMIAWHMDLGETKQKATDNVYELLSGLEEAKNGYPFNMSSDLVAAEFERVYAAQKAECAEKIRQKYWTEAKEAIMQNAFVSDYQSLINVNFDDVRNNFIKAHNNTWPMPTEDDVKWLMNEYKKLATANIKGILNSSGYRDYSGGVDARLLFTSARTGSELSQGLAIMLAINEFRAANSGPLGISRDGLIRSLVSRTVQYHNDLIAKYGKI